MQFAPPGGALGHPVVGWVGAVPLPPPPHTSDHQRTIGELCADGHSPGPLGDSFWRSLLRQCTTQPLLTIETTWKQTAYAPISIYKKKLVFAIIWPQIMQPFNCSDLS